MGIFSKRPQYLEPPASDPFSLNTPLLYFSPHDAWTIRDACEGTQIFGAIGSGKTSGSGAAIANAFLRAGYGGIVMCAKPEERKLWEKYAREAGRSQHLVIFSPENPWRFNFLDYELRRSGRGGGQTENIVSLFTRIAEIVEGKKEVAGGDQFWERAMRQLVRNTVEILSLSKGTITLEDMARFIAEAPRGADDVGEDTDWRRNSYCAECIDEAQSKWKTSTEEHNFQMAARFWLQDFATLDPRTRSNVLSTFTGIADTLLHGSAWELFCTTTNIVPEVTYKNGAIIVLDISIQEYEKLGVITQGIFKFMFQRAILRRDAEKDPRPVFLWADEAQNFVSSFDYQYQAVARSAKSCTVYMTQNISNYFSALGAHGHDEAHALLGNFQTKIFHSNTDHPTNQYAADVIAQEWMTVQNYSASTGNNGPSSSGGGSESIQYKVLPARFTTLKKGGTPHNLEVEAIVFQGGRVWKATGDTYLTSVFKQG